MKKIAIGISTMTLGDETRSGAESYAAAVRDELEKKYPDARIDVSLVDDVTDSSFWSNDPAAEAEAVAIARRIWDNAEYEEV